MLFHKHPVGPGGGALSLSPPGPVAPGGNRAVSPPVRIHGLFRRVPDNSDPVLFHKIVVGTAGLEPATLPLEVDNRQPPARVPETNSWTQVCTRTCRSQVAGIGITLYH